ncbi:hypothetical protein ACP4OV_028104 [Aristida adscensionis]
MSGAVHALDIEGEPPVGQPPPAMLLNGLPILAGTPWGVLSRVLQLAAALVALVVICATKGFHLVPIFWYLVVGASFQCGWSTFVVLIDLYALLVKRNLQNRPFLAAIVIGDMIAGALIFSAASSSAGVTILLDDDLHICSSYHCATFHTVTAMGFASWFAAMSALFLNLWSLTSLSSNQVALSLVDNTLFGSRIGCIVSIFFALFLHFSTSHIIDVIELGCTLVALVFQAVVCLAELVLPVCMELPAELDYFGLWLEWLAACFTLGTSFAILGIVTLYRVWHLLSTPVCAWRPLSTEVLSGGRGRSVVLPDVVGRFVQPSCGCSFTLKVGK